MATKPLKLPFTRYHTIRQKDGSYAVEVTGAGDSVPVTVTGFTTEADADGWATTTQISEAERAPVRPLKRPRDPT